MRNYSDNIIVNNHARVRQNEECYLNPEMTEEQFI